MRLDKTQFSKGTHEELAEQNKAYLHNKTLSERWAMGTYLTLVAYGMLETGFPKMEKVFVRKGKHIQ